MNYYQILQVDRNATTKQIKKHYYKLARQYHPDKHNGNLHKCEEFKLLSADELIENEFSKYEFYKKYYRHFQVLNLLRILPYSKNKKLINNLIKEIRLLCLL